jgi:hypothetical protein
MYRPPVGTAALQHIIDQAGSLYKLANDLNLPATTVRAWLTRGNIPAQYCPALEAYSVMLAGGRDKKGYILSEQLNNATIWQVIRSHGPIGEPLDRRIATAWQGLGS